MKIIGLLCGWGNERFIRPALDQALQMCDEVLVNISAHSDSVLKYEDDSLNIIKNEYPQCKLILPNFTRSNHSIIKASILNTMLYYSDNFEPGNWIMILDIDEFYTEYFINGIHNMLSVFHDYNSIEVEEYYFYINMQKYLEGSHNRLFKIREENLDMDKRFRPTQNWYCSEPRHIIISREVTSMFHYSMLLDHNMKRDFWLTEYPGKDQSNKVKWLDTIYLNYELKHEGYWTDMNRANFGIKSPWFSDSFKPNSNGHLFTYHGKHPKVIEESGLTEIKDFRKLYNGRL